MRSDPGTYALLLQPRAGAPARIRIGRLGPLRPGAAAYVYVGSALGPGGVRARLRRHRARRKRLHWHVDHLRAHCRLLEAWVAYGSRRAEHEWAEGIAGLEGASIPLPGFGASDCGCRAHLFAFPETPSFRAFADGVGEAPERLPLGRPVRAERRGSTSGHS